MSQQEFPKVTFHFSSEYQVRLQRYHHSEGAKSHKVSSLHKSIALTFFGD